MRGVETRIIIATELDEIWSRLGQCKTCSEQDFLTVARWAYHAMPPESISSAMFRLFEYAHSAPRPTPH